MSLRVTDQETARVVIVFRRDGSIGGAGCLLDHRMILTCHHVLNDSSSEPTAVVGQKFTVQLIGVTGAPKVTVILRRLGSDEKGLFLENPSKDLALLEILDGETWLDVAPTEFASPLSHGGKRFSVLGFPDGNLQGQNARGSLAASDAFGLVQMDREGALPIREGFSGAPVWSSDLSSFVGIVVTAITRVGVAWCIPSRLLCQFYPELYVLFRIPPSDRIQIHDYESDDPNVRLFGNASRKDGRELAAKIEERKDHYEGTLTYICRSKTIPPRGHYVTFILHSSFTEEDQDSYELFAELKDGVAETQFYPGESFTVAAVADGGDTALALDLKNIPDKPKSFY